MAFSRLLQKHNLVCYTMDHWPSRLQEETTALSEDLAVMVKENQLITSQLGDTTQRMEESRKDGDAAHASAGILQQTVKARELELGDLRTAYEGLAAEARHHEATISQLKRQLTGSATELEGAKREVLHVRDTAHSSQQQIQQYVVDVQALERNSDALARELQGSKREAEELASDRNRVLEQMQAIQVRPSLGFCKVDGLYAKISSRHHMHTEKEQLGQMRLFIYLCISMLLYVTCHGAVHLPKPAAQLSCKSHKTSLQELTCDGVLLPIAK